MEENRIVDKKYKRIKAKRRVDKESEGEGVWER